MQLTTITKVKEDHHQHHQCRQAPDIGRAGTELTVLRVDEVARPPLVPAREPQPVGPARGAANPVGEAVAQAYQHETHRNKGQAHTVGHRAETTPTHGPCGTEWAWMRLGGGGWYVAVCAYRCVLLYVFASRTGSSIYVVRQAKKG